MEIMESSQQDIWKSLSYNLETWYADWEWWVDYLINYWKQSEFLRSYVSSMMCRLPDQPHMTLTVLTGL